MLEEDNRGSFLLSLRSTPEGAVPAFFVGCIEVVPPRPACPPGLGVITAESEDVFRLDTRDTNPSEDPGPNAASPLGNPVLRVSGKPSVWRAKRSGVGKSF
jgi:hypothetical protein